MKKRIYQILTVWILAALLLSGCSAGGTDNTSSAGVMQTYTYRSDEAKGYNGNKEETAEAAVVMDSAEMDTAAAEDFTEDAGTVSPEISEKNLSSRKLIKTVSLSMETRTFDDLKTRMEESITSFGGYVENSSYDAPQGARQYRYYYLCVRIPAEHLDEFVNRAGELGTITSKSENVEDVTLDYVDKTAYKESLQTEYERVMELLAQAKDLEQILALESKLSELRYEINSYESQLRTYDNQIDYSTVHINISEVEYEPETIDTVGGRISSGFRSSLNAVRNFFVDSFVFVVSNLPVLVVLGALAVVIVIVVRKGKKKFRKKAAEEDGEDKDPK